LNKSARDLSSQSDSERRLRTFISETSAETDVRNVIDFSTEVRHEIPILRSHPSHDIEITIKIADNAQPYTNTNACVDLELRHPHGTQLQRIQNYILPIQISNAFKHNPQSQALLITNSATTLEEIEKWHSMFYDGMGMQVDVWNIGVNGKLGFDTNVIELYHGMTAIILGNCFEYFQRGSRNALDLLEHQDFFNATVKGTSFLISESGQSQLRPLFLSRSVQRFRAEEFQTCKSLVIAVMSAHNSNQFWDRKFIYRPRRGGVARCKKKAH